MPNREGVWRYLVKGREVAVGGALLQIKQVGHAIPSNHHVWR
jgi:hypothetical protein